MAALEEPASNLFMIDETYEFSAPRFYDFMCEETDEDVRKAELWFENARPYAPSPFMPRIKATRNVQLQILCNFGEDEKTHKAQSEKVPTASNSAEEPAPKSLNHMTHEAEVISAESNEEVRTNIRPQADITPAEIKENSSGIEKTLDAPVNGKCSSENIKHEAEVISAESNEEVRTNIRPQADITPAEIKENSSGIEKTLDAPVNGKCSSENINIIADKPSSSLHMEAVQGPEVCCTPAPQKPIESKKTQTAKKIASILKNPSALNSKKQLPKSQAKSTKPTSVRRDTNAKNIVGTPNFAQENPAIKRQKLEGGKSRQILTINKPSNLPHKTRTGIITNTSNFCSSAAKTKTSKEDRKMYVREPAAPFVSTAEMMRKFQSGTREVSLPRGSSLSQIFEAPSLPPLPRSTPHPPEFKEFHLETMSRANQNAETSTVASTESTVSHQWKPYHLTAPKSPLLQTSLRARPPKIKSSEELEKEELENVPQFKARPLNRKILESKGDMGIFCNMKKQVTIPEEFHFAIDKRIPPPTAVVDLFDKLSISSLEPHHEKPLPRNTTPNPFHLHTEERGAEKEKRLAEELLQKQLEEERARVPKAHPYPYTTDYPVIPSKPEPKPCTKPEPFQLESLDPIPVPEKERKPLTEVQEFNLHVEHRAVDRAEFDKKIKEKEMVYKRYREEAESARMMEEEKALKQLRRTLVPHARPVPSFEHPFLPQKSDKGVTKPKSPKLRVNRRKEKRRIVCTAGTTSGTTAYHHMR
ncbi:hypothetical protein DH2020_031333 [Rehmannia glutinosa]|uniref:TPX2 C-terminal domain-containing protein n=1 Tax=Rehmannia glutinosa TaxID=99300 RepID=A0ABR0VJY3_REHGL